MYDIRAHDAPTAYHEALGLMRVVAKEESTRNGKVWAIPTPFFLTIRHPTRRVIRCPIRNANPFFHIMETVWMFAGRRDVEWLSKFNRGIEQYADGGIIHGAYGYRWLRQWGNQISRIVGQLRADPNSRQTVLTMWDPGSDLELLWRDRPCNTHIYFRILDDKLHMTVCNRSNDLVWGMFGANVVHMTYLQELVATAIGVELGDYNVFTNNLHFYQNVYPNGAEIWNNLIEGPNPYPYDSFPILSYYGLLHTFLEDCQWFVMGEWDRIDSPWLKSVAKPMHDAYLCKTLEERRQHALLVEDKVWQKAAIEWLERIYAKKELSNR